MKHCITLLTLIIKGKVKASCAREHDPTRVSWLSPYPDLLRWSQPMAVCCYLVPLQPTNDSLLLPRPDLLHWNQPMACCFEVA